MNIWLAEKLFQALFQNIVIARKPDFIVGEIADPYLLRYWLIPRNRFFNAYLHCFMRSDDDRALHDHPWVSLSFLLKGDFLEHTIDRGGINNFTYFGQGILKYRGAKYAHRIELITSHKTGKPNPAWTIFITGPRFRDWGFHCAQAGWIPWQRFTQPDDAGKTGAGCEG